MEPMNIISQTQHDKYATTIMTEQTTVQSMSGEKPAIIDVIPVQYESIKDFLKKPSLVTTGVWSASNSRGVDIALGAIGPLLLSNTYWAEKYHGFSMIRGTAVVRLMINANPFQQGLLMLRYLPCYSRFTSTSTGYESMYNTSIVSKTQHPGVYLDARDSAAELRIPYIAPTKWYSSELSAQTYDWGTWFVTVIGELLTGATATSDTVDYSVYVHFEDIEMAAPILLQSGVGATGKYRAKKLDASALETKGTLSSALMTGAAVADACNDIPFVKDYAGVTAWVLRHTARVAAALGYSKPENFSTVMPVASAFQRNLQNCTGQDNSFNLGLFSDTKTPLRDNMSIRSEDEMSMSFLKQIEAYYATITWSAPSTGTNAGVNLFSLKVTPEIFNNTTTVTRAPHSLTGAFGPPIYYLSRYFSMWRGSIKVRVYIPKTQFHIGRLQVTWTPSPDVTNTPTISNSQNSLREIIDIRDGNEFELVLPWLLPTNYQMLGEGLYSGQLDIVILNDLKCPDTAAQSVGLILFVSGGKDFEFQGSAGRLTSEKISTVVSLEGNDITDGAVGDSIILPTNLMIAAECVGECFTSVKQLIAKLSRVYQVAPLTSFKNVVLYPYNRPVPYLAPVSGLTSGNTGGFMLVDISLMYAFFKGGITAVFNHLTSTSNGNMTCYNYPYAGYVATDMLTSNTYGAWNYTSGSWTQSSAKCAAPCVADKSVGYVSVTIPYQSPTQFSMCYPNSTNTYPLSSTTYDAPIGCAVLDETGTVGVPQGTVGIAAAEDFQLAFFISCPPVLTGYS
jgi:hypothetical protein